MTSPGPKRILALDGGGVRGALTLGFLDTIERTLRARHQKPDLRLCDYFDLIGGTSTGAIIAGGLAMGMEVKEIQQIYLEMVGKVFGKKRKIWMVWNWKKRLAAAFDKRPFEEELAKVFGETTLGDQDMIKTGICIITKRADTGSIWSLINHPNGMFYEQNSKIMLRDAIRASSAAPTYFLPELLNVGQNEKGAFVDGGVSMAKNPALQLFLVATLKGFPFQWSIGEDNLLLVSVGTGFWHRQDVAEKVVKGRLWNWVTQVPSMLMEDANWQNQIMLQYMSRTLTPWEIDREMGNLEHDLLSPSPSLSYLRYDVLLDGDSLNHLGLSNLGPRLESLREMSAAENLGDLAMIGEAAADRQIQDGHFPKTFDLTF